MGTVLAWTTAVAMLIAGMFALRQLGVSVGPMITTIVRGVAHFLGHPL
ncbi:MAG: hypothetical protein L3J87_03140 [Thermoplasmata archaeon]|nr:hypothetical protein [Thermoplasmata archaeon]MCI4344603.1 hypothetical protein [Thermoplasmata archaeon]